MRIMSWSNVVFGRQTLARVNIVKVWGMKVLRRKQSRTGMQRRLRRLYRQIALNV